MTMMVMLGLVDEMRESPFYLLDIYILPVEYIGSCCKFSDSSTAILQNNGGPQMQTLQFKRKDVFYKQVVAQLFLFTFNLCGFLYTSRFHDEMM